MADDTTQQQQDTTEEVGKNTAASPGENGAPAAKADGDHKGETLTLTQDALDRIIEERLTRQRSQLQRQRQQEQEQAEAARLAEQGEFKTLAEQRQARIAELEQELSSRDTDLLRSQIAAAKKLDPDLIPFVTATTAAEITAQVETLVKKTAAPQAPKYEGAERPKTGVAAVEDNVKAFAQSGRYVGL